MVGRLDERPGRNPYPYPGGIFDGGPAGADFTVGAVHRGVEMGNFFAGLLGGLAVYQRALSDPTWRAWWTSTYGPQLPQVLWVAPHQERADEIRACWQHAWPDGDWWVTTDEGRARFLGTTLWCKKCEEAE